MIEVGVVNSYILYYLHTRRPATHLAYRRQVVEALATHHLQSCLPRSHPGRPRKRPRATTSGDTDRLNGHTHVLDRRAQPQDCIVCSRREGERHRSLYYCKTCQSHPTLCVVPCFEHYHTMSQYKCKLSVFPFVLTPSPVYPPCIFLFPHHYSFVLTPSPVYSLFDLVYFSSPTTAILLFLLLQFISFITPPPPLFTLSTVYLAVLLVYPLLPPLPHTHYPFRLPAQLKLPHSLCSCPRYNG